MKRINHIGQRMSGSEHLVLVHFLGENKPTVVAKIDLSTSRCIFTDKRYMKSRFIITEVKEVLLRIRSDHEYSHYFLTFGKEIVDGKQKAEEINGKTHVSSDATLKGIKAEMCEILQISKSQLPLVTIHKQADFLKMLDDSMVVVDKKHIAVVTIHLKAA